MKRLLAAAVTSAALFLASSFASSAQVVTAGYSLQAWCVGGIAGRWDKATIASDGTISVTNSAIQAEPWPVAATEPKLAEQWIGQAIEAEARALDNRPPVYRDAINCGLDLYHPDGTRTPAALVDVFNALIAYVPPRGF